MLVQQTASISKNGPQRNIVWDDSAIGEGFEVLEKSEFNFDYENVAREWNNGSVIRSGLMNLTERAFPKDANLEQNKGTMHSSGEGKWTVETALDLQAAIPVIDMSLLMRYRSLDQTPLPGKWSLLFGTSLVDMKSKKSN